MKNIVLLGCGNISDIYLQNLSESKSVNLLGVCDMEVERAQHAQKEYSLEKYYDCLDDILVDPKVDLIINLTPPKFHYDLNKAILDGGKSLYCEKPLALSYDKAKELVDLAESKSLLCAGAPDTYMGDSFAFLKQNIESGLYGKTISLNMHLYNFGIEAWHPSPEFFFKDGGGPFWDMGPYYITLSTYLFGSISAVTALGKKQYTQRTIGSEPKFGQKFDVEIDTHISALLQFESGVLATLTMSFDVGGGYQPNFEAFLEKVNIKVPDPNFFGDVIHYLDLEDPHTGWQPYSVKKHGFNFGDQRGRGVEDLLLNNGKGLMSYKYPLHTVEVIEKIIASCKSNSLEKIESRV